MKPLSYAKLYEFFLQTLDHCGLFLLNEDTDSIEWHLFEEFDSGSITFLHENTLDCLLDGGNITAEVAQGTVLCVDSTGLLCCN